MPLPTQAIERDRLRLSFLNPARASSRAAGKQAYECRYSLKKPDLGILPNLNGFPGSNVLVKKVYGTSLFLLKKNAPDQGNRCGRPTLRRAGPQPFSWL